MFSSEGLTPSLQGAQIIRCWKSVPVEGPQQGECTSRRWKEREGAESAQEREQAGESREREREQEREDRGRPEAKHSHLSQQTGASHSLRASHPEVKKKRGLSSSSILQPMQFHQPKFVDQARQHKTKHTGDVVKGQFMFRSCQHMPFYQFFLFFKNFFNF